MFSGLNKNDIEETITGSVLTAGIGQNVSRQIAISAGIPEERNAFTINKVCSSSLKALIVGAQSIQLGVRQKCLIVGVENMSQAPFYLARGDHGYGDLKIVVGFRKFYLKSENVFQDSIPRDGISDAILNDPMGLCAEKTAKDYQITRQAQDTYALSSYERATNAWNNNEFQDEIVAVTVKQRRGPDVVVSQDEEYKRLIPNKVPTLPAAFLKDGTGKLKLEKCRLAFYCCLNFFLAKCKSRRFLDFFFFFDSVCEATFNGFTAPIF